MQLSHCLSRRPLARSPPQATLTKQPTPVVAIAVDSTSNAYVTGYTNSVDFPVTSGAARTELASGASEDAFVAKIPVVARWEQAFSKDGGKTWETNWYNEFIHDKNCTPTS